MTKFGKSGKTRLSGSLFRNIRFWQFQYKTKEGTRLEDSRCFEACKRTKKYQEAEMEEIQDKSQSCKNRTVRFWKLEYPVFSKKDRV
jgi:hypothetical protein